MELGRWEEKNVPKGQEESVAERERRRMLLR